ncbi:MAG: MerR family transcriptional regulator [Vagococcus sp.]|uniref:MerR family transcriptional regulator n=1 Tax=Vagococcus TaxID=2737 RepID=UPI002FCBB86D
MNDLIKIGEFAKLNHISIQTLRYYEKIGLIEPIKIDELTNYRYYNLMQSAILDMILFLKDLDFSLIEIKDILEKQDNVDFLQEKLLEQQVELEKKSSAIQIKISQMELFREATSIYENQTTSRDLQVIKLPDRPIIKYRIPKNIYQMTPEEYEYYLRDFKLFLSEKYPNVPSCSRIGSLMDRSLFYTESIYSDELFVFFSNPSKKRDKTTQIKAIDCLKGGYYAVAYCDDFAKEAEMIHEFRDKIKKQGLEITGNYICEIIYEVPKLHQAKRNMFIRMQVPVRKKIRWDRLEKRAT